MSKYDHKNLSNQWAEFSGIDWRQSVDQIRSAFFRAVQKLEVDPPVPGSVNDLLVDGADGPLRARLYTPKACGKPPGPGIVFFHGGGFVLGDIESHDALCRRLADSSRCRLISLDYRRAPEHKFPAAFDDAVAAWQWVMARAEAIGFDHDRVAVAGDSAGANLAAGIALHTLRSGEREPAMQALFYPLLQLVDTGPGRFGLKQGFFLSNAALNFFKRAYLHSSEDALDERVSPLLVDDLAGIAPAYVVTAGLDPLQSEGRAWAEKLAALGVPVTHRDYPSQTHGFFMFTALSVVARDGVRDAGLAIGRTLGVIGPEPAIPARGNPGGKPGGHPE